MSNTTLSMSNVDELQHPVPDFSVRMRCRNENGIHSVARGFGRQISAQVCVVAIDEPNVARIEIITTRLTVCAPSSID